MPRTPRPAATDRRGFSLVLSLTVMAMLLLICISAAAMLSVELRVARSSVSVARARMNALASARIALGEIQRLMGPDQRVSANASILDGSSAYNAGGDTDGSAGVEQPRLTGVWRGVAVAQNYDASKVSQFLGWLSSGTDPKLTGQQARDWAKTRSASAASGGIKLYDGGDSSAANYQGVAVLNQHDRPDIYALPENIPVTDGVVEGRFAWVAIDQNQKASLSARDLDTTSTAAAKSTRVRSARRIGADKAGTDGFGGWISGQTPVPAYSQSKTPSWNSLEMEAVDSTVADAPHWFPSAAKKSSKPLWHDLALDTVSLLTDTVNGGLRYDVSTMSALTAGSADSRPGPGSMPTEYKDRFIGLEAIKAGWRTNTATFSDTAQTLWAPVNTQMAVNPPALGNAAYLDQLEWSRWNDIARFANFTDGGSTAMPNVSWHTLSWNGTKPYLPYAGTSGGVELLDSNSEWRRPVLAIMDATYRLKYDASKKLLFIQPQFTIGFWNPYNVAIKLPATVLPDGRLTSFANVFNITVTKDDGTTATGYWSMGVGSSNQYFTRIDVQGAQAELPPGECRIYTPSSFDAGGGVTDVTSRYYHFTEGYSTTELGLDPTVATNGWRPVYTGASSGTGALTIEPTSTVTIRSAATQAHIIMDDQTQGTTGFHAAQGFAIDSSAVRMVDGLNILDNFPVQQLTGSVGKTIGRASLRLKTETTTDTSVGIGDFVRFNTVIRGGDLNNSRWKNGVYDLAIKKMTSDSDYNVRFPQLNFAKSPQGTSAGSGTRQMNSAYFGTGWSPENASLSYVYSHVPVTPLTGLGDLRYARLGGGASYRKNLTALPGSKTQLGFDNYTTTTTKNNNTIQLTQDYGPQGTAYVHEAFGNSFAHPMIPATQLTASNEDVKGQSYYDFSWITNTTLWDGYFISSLSDWTQTVSPMDVRGDRSALLTAFLQGSGTKGFLPNGRLKPDRFGTDDVMKSALLDPVPANKAYTKTAAAMLVNGGFNVNSTSPRAWRMFLSGLNEETLTKLSYAAGFTTQEGITSAFSAVSPASAGMPVVRGMTPILSPSPAGSTSGGDFNARRVLGGRYISESKLDELAARIVTEVKKRGPFLSLGEFINRRLDGTPLGYSGAVQSAIDAAGLNDSQTTTGLPVTAAGQFSPKGTAAYSGRGLPGYVTQADLLAPYATALTPRGDTFVIRAYGEFEGASSYCEVTVRRTYDYVNPVNARWEAATSYSATGAPSQNAAFVTANKAFGRRFTLVGTRWLSAEEI